MGARFEGVVTGVVTGTGSLINVPVGFAPKRVTIQRRTGQMMEWSNVMSDGVSLKFTVSGVTLPGSTGIARYAGETGIASQGFTIGADTDLNVEGDDIFWTVYY